MDAAELLASMWRRKMILLLVVSAVLGATAWTYVTAPVEYESRAKVALLPDADIPELVPFYGQAVESLLPTYAEILTSLSFLEEVSDRLEGSVTAAELQTATRGQPVAQLGVLEVVAVSATPQRAQLMAQATAEQLVDRLSENGIVSVTLLDDARLPQDPTAPSPTVVVAVALMVGLGLGALAAILWDRYSRRVTTVDELADASDLPVLAAMPEMRRLAGRSVVIGDPRFAQLEESLRSLRTNLLFAGGPNGRGTLMFTGLNPSDGKSTVAANMAVLVAELGMSVVLVDADLHRPVQHEFFGLSNDRGLTSLISEGADVEDVMMRTRFENLRVVPSGPPIASRAVELQVYLDGVRRIESAADVLIIDSPPLDVGDEVRLLAAYAEGVVLLVRSGASTSREVQQTLDHLKLADVDVLGLILARSSERAGGDAYRQYREPVKPAKRRRATRRPDPSAIDGGEHASGSALGDRASLARRSDQRDEFAGDGPAHRTSRDQSDPYFRS